MLLQFTNESLTRPHRPLPPSPPASLRPLRLCVKHFAFCSSQFVVRKRSPPSVAAVAIHDPPRRLTALEEGKALEKAIRRSHRRFTDHAYTRSDPCRTRSQRPTSFDVSSGTEYVVCPTSVSSPLRGLGSARLSNRAAASNECMLLLVRCPLCRRASR